MAHTSLENALIGSMAPGDRDQIIAASTELSFELGEILSEPGDVVDSIYFVEEGIVSGVATMRDGRSVEAYMVGREGFVGLAGWLVPGRSQVRHNIQTRGRARRLDAARLRDLVDASTPMRRVMASYAVALQRELEQSTACNALHPSEQRFAKWLLRAHDRSNGDLLQMTQEFLANMLGSQRTTVNEAAQNLARQNAIAYSRGKLMVIDRAALEAAACECYAAARSAAGEVT